MIEDFKKKSLKKQIFYGAILVLIAIISIYLITSSYSQIFYNHQKLNEVVTSFGVFAPLAYIGIMILQILFAPIPGHVIYFVGGILFGVWGGIFYGLIGLSIGTFIGISIGRFLGRPFVETFVSEKHMEKFDDITHDVGLVAMFLLFLLPGPPDDVLCLLAGLTDLDLKKLMVAVLAGRGPGLIAMIWAGESFVSQQWVLFGVIIGVVAIISILVLNYREEIIRRV
ncbi:TVP38/TMEM64 family protein [archaeon SCG-AAA382B04]|nr:TVP38/TMEM64 family protein [archaeon SCG-AAA382B04]